MRMLNAGLVMALMGMGDTAQRVRPATRPRHHGRRQGHVQPPARPVRKVAAQGEAPGPGMTYTRKYRPPYTRKPPPALLAADALWDEARDEDRRLEALEAELALMSDEYDFGGSL